MPFDFSQRCTLGTWGEIAMGFLERANFKSAAAPSYRRLGRHNFRLRDNPRFIIYPGFRDACENEEKSCEIPTYHERIKYTCVK